ncbi:hypothetical protein A2971_00370 [Candidatus Gottesmanbacteria bacterium RIFCSPLOWO2_01_FULL_46_21]|uniref:Uncharacterized protein n=1 Tax=Candidatus Gottesmanbacteria bacterium RIFCSPLOWO2_01_FULL_46_21 TaxID=1798393 RepID=A0A1F6B138_9BACT|nr:MAG: hypothetical protein A2971_00370 [Candidatus Gottesmanbacteria bacterium RIFCSPLOWO2_01_FULL_46_21]
MKQREIQKYSSKFSRILDVQQINRLLERLNRISNKIAPLSTDTGNTQTINRWELEKTNPHFASEEQCSDIYLALLDDLVAFLKITSAKPRYLLPFFSGEGITPKNLIATLNTSSRIGSLELPIWYKTDPIKGGKHQKDNIFWFSPYEDLEIIRKLVANKMIVTKIQVKAYLTDRRQTGDYQTNREIRWESHPNSPQYASRIDCMQIEAKL